MQGDAEYRWGKTIMLRLKTIFGATLRARGGAAQEAETLLRLDALNRMTA